MRMVRAGMIPARTFQKLGGAAAGLLLAAAPLPSFAATSASAAKAAPVATAVSSGSEITDFYRARGGRPLWLAPQSQGAVQLLLGLLNGASADGLDPNRYEVGKVADALRAAQRGDRRSVDRAEMLLSQAFVAYARALRRRPDIDIVYVDRELVPAPPPARYLLESAASAPSLAVFVDSMGWMNPTYAQLRRAVTNHSYSDDVQRRTLMLNLERARALPAGNQRYVVVNAAAQRLFMYDNGQLVDSMLVVVGKPKYPTPMMNAFIRAAALNPYWNVPPDLAAERIAPGVVKQGVPYLKASGYELLSDWTDKATVIDPSNVDWKAVEDGRVEVRIRQLPGPH